MAKIAEKCPEIIVTVTKAVLAVVMFCHLWGLKDERVGVKGGSCF